jgi:NAD(P)-dependent dehydrogenase (short-subunit alcohol dehydrogenase family)
MTGKTVLITGATHGIGLAAARELAGRDATVVLTGRSAGRCAAAAGLLRATHPNATVEWLIGDLAVQSDVRELAAEYQRRYDRLDVLVNNAGTIEPKASYTAEGIERTLAVNHLGPFLLTNLLADLLIASAPSRVITVASVAHERGRIDFTDLELRRRYRPFQAYARSKLANLLFTYELARRLEGTDVTANAMNPGLVRTGLGRHQGLVPSLGYLVTHLIYRRHSLTPEQGADTIVYLSSAPDVASTTGEYFYQRKPVASSAASHDAAAAEQLWGLSEQLTGVQWRVPAPG